MNTTESVGIENLIQQLEEAARQAPAEVQKQIARRLALLAGQFGISNDEPDARESEERFQSVLQYSQDVVYRRNLQANRYDYISASSALILTYSPEEMLAMPITVVLEHIHPDDRRRVEEGIHSANQTGSARLEYRWRGKDGRYRWLADYITVQLDEAGQPLYRGGILRDITSQIEAAENARHSEARFRIALDGSPVTVFAHDCELRYQWVFNSFFKLPVEQILGKRDDELLPPEDVAELIAVKQDVLATGQSVHREVHLRMDGQDYWRIVTAEPVRGETGAVTGVRGAGIDVTEVRRLQMENQERVMSVEVQRRLMEFREQERQEIARELHDGPIQTLVSVLFHLQMVRDACTDPAQTGDFDQIVQGLKTAVRNLRETVNELRPPSLIHFGLSKVIQMHALDFQERHPQILLKLELFDDQNQVDDQVSLVLFRIYQEGLNNALLHAGATRVEVRYRMSAGQLVLELRDNGQGFAVPEDLREFTRTGQFGLAGMVERAEAVGGKVTVDSTPGQGMLLQASVPYRPK